MRRAPHNPLVGSIDSFREDSFMGQSSFGFAVERAMPDARHVKSVTYPVAAILMRNKGKTTIKARQTTHLDCLRYGQSAYCPAASMTGFQRATSDSSFAFNAAGVASESGDGFVPSSAKRATTFWSFRAT